MNNIQKKKDYAINITKTATDDLKFQLVTADQWIREGNFIVSSQVAKYGTFSGQDSTLPISSVLSFQDFNLKDIYFINAAAGSNTNINFVGILMTDGRKRELGVDQ